MDKTKDCFVEHLLLARKYEYHPGMKGSCTINKVLPTIVSELSYGNLDEVQDAGDAQIAYLEAINP